MSKSNSGRTTAIIGYLTIVGCLIGITMNAEPKNAFARFHLRQAFGIHLIFHSLSFFFNYSNIESVWMVLYLGYLILWIYGLAGAIAKKERAIPLVGTYFQKWFTFIP